MEELELLPISSMFEEVEEGVDVDDVKKDDIDDTSDTKDTKDKDVETKITSDDSDNSDDSDELEDDEVDLESAKTLYKYWKDFLPLDETEEPTEDFLREQQEKLPEKFFMSYVDNRPDFIKDLLVYQSQLENPTVDDVKSFFDKFVIQEDIDVTDNDSARNFLKTRPEFTKLYKTSEKMDRALDMLEDDEELVERAKELLEEDKLKKEESKKETLRLAQEQKEKNMAAQKEFATKVNATIEELQWKPEKKNKVTKELNPANISAKWDKIRSNPKALVQFADFLSYLDDNGFDAFFNVLEGKEKSKEVTKIKSNLEKDSLGKLLGKQTIPQGKKGFLNPEEVFG